MTIIFDVFKMVSIKNESLVSFQNKNQKDCEYGTLDQAYIE